MAGTVWFWNQGSGGFTPDDVAGLEAWYDLSNASSLYTDNFVTNVSADGQSIYTIDDLAGNGHYMQQTTAGSRPTYKTAIINGRSVGRFDGSADTIANVLAADTSFTLFIVAQKRSAPGGSAQTLFAMDVNAQLYTDAVVDSGYVWLSNEGGGQELFGQDPTDVNVIVLRVTSASSASVLINGGAGTGFDPDNVLTTATSYHFGSRLGGNFGDYDYGEIIAYNVALSASDTDLVGEYLATKWGTSWTATGSSTHSRSAALGATATIAASGVVPTAGVAQGPLIFLFIAEEEGVLSRSAALDATASIAASGGVSGDEPYSDSYGEAYVTGGATGAVAISGTATIAASGGILGVITGAAAIAATAEIAASGGIPGVVTGAAAVSGTASIASSGEIAELHQVQNLRVVTISSTQLNLLWDDTALSGEAFDIERDGVVIVQDHDDTSYSDTGLDPRTSYTYRVRAVTP